MFITKKTTFWFCQLLVLLGLLLGGFACGTKVTQKAKTIETQIEEGFKYEIVAAEPMLEAPVALEFDRKGRIWVVEMPGYMPNIDGTDEDEPTGRISILEDTDSDGNMDKQTIFLDNLVLPRAMALVYDGLLYAEPPNLWFVTIENDKPGKKVLVDSLFAVGGNVEHQPNGLLLNIDNWIYCAKSNHRYRRVNGEWKKEVTFFRGQWGISKDNYGRLVYNDNSNQLLGDYVMPNLLMNNEYLEILYNMGQPLTTNQNVYPLHATAVNRGYIDGWLAEDGKLLRFTSACGPVIYRGTNFPEEYANNAFVCAPEANLIKRNICEDKEGFPSARQAWDDKEFYATTDEAFRPVNLYNAPDGTLYGVDFHRGVIQHRVYMTNYLRDLLLERELDKEVGKGRIFRLVFPDRPIEQIPDFDNLNTKDLVALLQHPNGWTRDQAQQLLVQKQDKASISLLKTMAVDTAHQLAQIHALWTLEGLDALDMPLFESVLEVDASTHILATIVYLLEKVYKEENYPATSAIFKYVAAMKRKYLDLYLLGQLTDFTHIQGLGRDMYISTLFKRHKDSLVAEAAVNSLAKQEGRYINFLTTKTVIKVDSWLVKTLQNVQQNRLDGIKSKAFTEVEVFTDDKTVGLELYKIHCSVCHGMNGKGITNMAPPLLHSEYVDSPEKTALIILHGMEGPLHVNGQRYEFNALMPGLKDNPSLTDEDIAGIVNFVNNSFSETIVGISGEEVSDLRAKVPKEGKVYTEKELNKL